MPRLLTLFAAIMIAFAPLCARAEDDAKFAEAMKEQDSEKHRLAMRDLANTGNLRAAARLIDLDPFEQMKDLDMKALEPWRTSKESVGAKTAVQIHAAIQWLHAKLNESV